MAKEPMDKTPEGKGGPGKEKEESADAEVAGRGKQLVLYTCFNDGGAGSYIDPDWKWFTCWRCGQLVVLNE
jgi:hypothetical protein